MAVCGRCWICSDKFTCRARKSCGDCTGDKPAEVRDPDGNQNKICGECVDHVESGTLGSLVHAIRAAAHRDQS